MNSRFCLIQVISREITQKLTSFSLKITSRFTQMEIGMWNPVHAKCQKFSPTWIFRQIDLQYNSLVKNLIWRNFCKKLCGKNYEITTLCKICSQWKLVLFLEKCLDLGHCNHCSKMTKRVSVNLKRLKGASQKVLKIAHEACCNQNRFAIVNVHCIQFLQSILYIRCFHEKKMLLFKSYVSSFWDIILPIWVLLWWQHQNPFAFYFEN